MFKKTLIYAGEFIGKLINPIVLGFIFYILLTPITIVTKFFGRDELNLKLHNQKSYWKLAEKTFDKKFFKRQF